MPSRSRGAPKQTTTQRGYGGDHQENRRRLMSRHTNGKPCWWCGKPMYREPEKNWDKHPLEAHHSKSLAQHGRRGNAADSLLHKTCNIQCGDGTRDHLRPTRIAREQADAHHPTNTHPTEEAALLGHRAMAWPTDLGTSTPPPTPTDDEVSTPP